MGILADWQIQAASIITPFEPQRERLGILSFGCSSYGYDARVGYKFRVFSPINAKEIDPKNFDPKALVDVDLTPDKPHDIVLDEFSENTFSCSMCGADVEHTREGEMCKSSKPDHILIPPHSFALAETVEHFNIPRDCLALVVGKSTYARCGLVVNCTPLEPEWHGKVTVELSNTTPLPMWVYAGEGIMQVLFFRSDGYMAAQQMILESFARRLLVYGETLCGVSSGDPGGTVEHIVGKGTCRVSYADKRGKYQGQVGLTLPIVEDLNDPRR
jgi:dCTP deaminase